MQNAAIAMLPQDDDWNVVVNLTGDTSWEADKMRKYFKQIEKNQYLPPGNPAHGYNGNF
jgi:choline dehydrogenase